MSGTWAGYCRIEYTTVVTQERMRERHPVGSSGQAPRVSTGCNADGLRIQVVAAIKEVRYLQKARGRSWQVSGCRFVGLNSTCAIARYSVHCGHRHGYENGQLKPQGECTTVAGLARHPCSTIDTDRTGSFAPQVMMAMPGNQNHASLKGVFPFSCGEQCDYSMLRSIDQFDGSLRSF